MLLKLIFQGTLSHLHHAPEQLQIPHDKLPYRRPENFDDNPRNSFQISKPNHSSKPNNKGEAEQRPRAPFRPPNEKRRKNKEIEYPDVYQDDPPPLIRPPSPGTRRNPEVRNKLAREIYDGHRVYGVWHYRGYKIRKIFAKKSTYPHC